MVTSTGEAEIYRPFEINSGEKTAYCRDRYDKCYLLLATNTAASVSTKNHIWIWINPSHAKSLLWCISSHVYLKQDTGN